MTVMVTLQERTKIVRRNYKSFDSAVKGIKKWLGSNDGIAIVYQQNRPPITYDCHSKLPDPFPKRKTNFYRTRAWRELRLQALKQGKSACNICGVTPEHGISLHVDHIKPRSKHPELELEISNLQVLCEDCNLAKSDNEMD